MRRTTRSNRTGGSRQRRGVRGASVIIGTVVALSAGTALAASVALTISSGTSVSAANGRTVREAIVATAHGHPVYRLTGDSEHHQRCTAANGCFAFWMPVTVTSTRAAKLAHGIHGTLAVWHRGRQLRLVLAGSPLYTFIGDRRAHHATGEGIRSFGGVWHVVTPSGHTTNTSSSSSTTTTRTSTSTTSTVCYYPPC